MQEFQNRLQQQLNYTLYITLYRLTTYIDFHVYTLFVVDK